MLHRITHLMLIVTLLLCPLLCMPRAASFTERELKETTSSCSCCRLDLTDPQPAEDGEEEPAPSRPGESCQGICSGAIVEEEHSAETDASVALPPTLLCLLIPDLPSSPTDFRKEDESHTHLSGRALRIFRLSFLC